MQVGDYVLSPDICVERKSVADLFGSLNSGRLFQQVLTGLTLSLWCLHFVALVHQPTDMLHVGTQAEKMSKFYRRPCLLIEFDEFKSFSFFHPDELPQSIVPTHSSVDCVHERGSLLHGFPLTVCVCVCVCVCVILHAWSLAVVSKLSLLFLHFPQLRVLWSRSPTMTSHLFEILKSNGEEPDVQVCVTGIFPI